MTQAYIMGLAKDALTLCLMLSAPVLAVSMVVGLAISLLQAMTQIHEVTLTFVPKLLACGLVLALLGSWMHQNLVHFTTKLLSSLALLAQ